MNKKIILLPSLFILILLSHVVLAQESGSQGAPSVFTRKGSNYTVNQSIARLIRSGEALKMSQEEIAALFNSAEQDYRENKFEGALIKYARIYQTGIQNHVLFYNLGNALYRLNRTGLAIWMWEKALKLRGDDEQTAQNLEIARSKLTYEYEEIPSEEHFLAAVFTRLAGLLGVDGWTLLVILFCWVFAIGLASLQIIRKPGLKRLILYLTASFFLLMFVSGVFAAFSYSQYIHENYGIVLTNRIDVRSGPGLNNPSLFPLYEGVRVKVEESESEWFRVSLPNGYNGWVPHTVIGLI